MSILIAWIITLCVLEKRLVRSVLFCLTYINPLNRGLLNDIHIPLSNMHVTGFLMYRKMIYNLLPRIISYLT